MAKKFDNKKALEDRLEKIKEAYLSKKMAKIVAEAVVKQIRKRTRLGYGAANNKQMRLKKLSTGYIKQRKEQKNLSSKTTPSKSNLTNTGEMLDDIDFKFKSTSDLQRSIEISIYNNSSRDKAENVSEERPFLNLTKAEQNLIKDLIKEEMSKYLKKN